MSTTLIRCECPDTCAKKINRHDLLSRNTFASHEEKHIEAYGNVRVSITHGQRGTLKKRFEENTTDVFI